MLFLASMLATMAPHCTPELATRTTIETLTSNLAIWVDRCVTVSALVSGRELYSGREEMYRSARRTSDGGHDPALERDRIGADWAVPGVRRSHLEGKARSVEVTGLVDSCLRRNMEAEVMVLGYCHYTMGPILIVFHRRPTGEPLERLVGEKARRRVGNLAELPIGRPGRAHLEGVARAFTRAIRAGDRAALTALLAGAKALPDEMAEAAAQADRLLRSPIYRELGRHEAGELKLYVQTKGGELPQADEHPEGFACFCRTSDCNGLWPISTIDADADTVRPYVCLEIMGRPDLPGGITVYAPEGGGWLAEPRP